MKRLAFALGLLSLLTALGIWRVASEPVPVSFLTPYLEEMLSRNRKGWQLSIQDTVLAWRGWKKPIDLRLRDVEVRDRQGDRVVMLPVVSVGLSLSALLQRRLGIRYLEVLQADLVIERDPAGHVAVRTTQEEDEGSDASTFALTMIEILLTPNDVAHPISFLELVRVEADRIVWRDEQRGVELSAAAVTLDARRADAGVQCEATLRLESDGRPGSQISMVAEARPKQRDGREGRGVDVEGIDFTVSIDARAQGIRVAELRRYWPAKVAPDARAWVTENISAGEVQEAVVHVTFDRDAGQLRKVNLHGTLGYTGLRVQYLSDWPEATSVTGSGSFDRRGLHFDVAGAVVGNLAVGRSKVEISGLDSDDERLRVRAPIRGTSNDIGTLIAVQSPELATHLALDPAAAADQATVEIDISLPLQDGLTASDVSILARADLPGLKSRNPFVEGVVATKVVFETSGGGEASAALDVDLTDAAMAIPRLSWRKAKGERGRAEAVLDLDSFRPTGARKVEIDAATLRVRGSLRLADEDRKLRSANLEEVSLGDTQLAKVVVEDSPEGWHIELGGGEIDAEPFLNTLSGQGGEAGGQERSRGWRLVAPQLRHISFKKDEALQNVSVRLAHDGKRWREMDVSGTTVGDGAGKFDFVLKPTSNGPDLLTAQVDDLGSLLRVLGLTTELRGGRLDATGETAVDGGPPLRMQVEMRKFEFLRSSLLTRLLTFASLRGFGKLAIEDAVAFDYLSGDLVFADGRATTNLIRTHGPALGLTITGWAGIGENDMDLDGAIVPAYAANRVLGKIPVLGGLLSGDGKEGFWAIRYQMRGTRQDPKMEVHTLTSLTPALLRNIFGKLERWGEGDGKTQ